MILQHRGRILCLCLATIAAGCTPRGTATHTTPPGETTHVVPPAQDVADAESDAQTLQSKVTRVTVYSDRARVNRQAAAQLTSEPTVFASCQGTPISQAIGDRM